MVHLGGVCAKPTSAEIKKSSTSFLPFGVTMKTRGGKWLLGTFSALTGIQTSYLSRKETGAAKEETRGFLFRSSAKKTP